MTATEHQRIETGHGSAYSNLINLIGYRWKWSALVEAASLNIASLLEEGPMTTEEIAARTGTHPSSLYHLLQFLAYSQIFAEVSPGCFAQTPLSSFLRADAIGSVRNLLLMQGSPWHTQAWDALGYSLQTGNPAFVHTHDKGIWDYFDEHAKEKHIFDTVMDDVSRIFTGQIVEAYDFGDVRTVVDVGGGHGALLLALLQHYTHLQGTLFDMSATIEGIMPQIAQGQLKRIAVHSGNFFESLPDGADVYLLKQILHDWDDAHALAILRTCRKAMHASSRLLIVEMFPQPVDRTPPPEGYPPFIGFLQLQMMVLFGGKERNEEEFAALLTQADLRLTRGISTRSPYRLLECRPTHSQDA